MKKFLALILALCMALAAASAVAEEDLSGEWYLLMSGLTAGTAVLNADGTCALDLTNGTEQVQAEGTWTAGDNSVTLIVEGSSLEFTSDGTNLVAQEMMLTLSREPGKLTIQEMTAYTTDGTLPEGMTEEEMSMILLEIMASMASGISETDEPDTAPAENTSLTVLEENYLVKEGYSGPEHWIYLKLQNNTDAASYLYRGSLTLMDAEGNEAGKAEWLYSNGSRYLEPGEITCVSFKPTVNEGMTPVSYSYAIETQVPDDYTTKDFAIETGTPELSYVLKEAGSYENKINTRFSITNNGEDPLAEVQILLILKDADGKILDMRTDYLYHIEIGGNSTIFYTGSFSDSVANYCISNNTVPGEVEAYVWNEESR